MMILRKKPYPLRRQPWRRWPTLPARYENRGQSIGLIHGLTAIF